MTVRLRSPFRLSSRLAFRALAIVALLASVSVGLAACGDDGSVLASGASGSTSTSTTSEAAGTPGATTTTTTEPTASTGSVPTTMGTTTLGTTTLGTTTTAAPTTTGGTTTTTAAPLALEFRPDGLGIVDFGATPARTIDAVRDYLGFAETFDSGWVPAWGDYGACPGTEHRHVEFDGLVLAFTDSGLFAPEGTRQFYSWAYLGTPGGITSGLQIGTTVTDLQAMYPAVEVGFDDMFFGDYFRVAYPDARGLWGTLTGPGPGDSVDFLTGGIGCGE